MISIQPAERNTQMSSYNIVITSPQI